MEQSESRMAPSPGTESDDFVSPINQHPEAAEPAGQASPGCSGAEGGGPGGPADRLAFDPVPLRYREDGLTPEKQRAYVEALADCGIAREAAARVGLTEQAINRVRRRADARSFDRACEAAHLFGARRLRSIAFERAIEGTVKGRYYRGELIAEERVYDNRLLIYLLGKTAHLLEPDEATSRPVCANWEAHMEALERGLPPPPDPPDHGFEMEQVWEDGTGLWRTSFPPPAGFEGDENRAWNGLAWYERSLSSREQAVMEARCDEEDAECLADQAASRDRFFGFEGGISSALEAETYETSEPFGPDPRPIEYKSLEPPSPACRPSLRRKPPAGPGNRVSDPSRRPAGLPTWTRAKEREGGEARRDIQTPPPRHPWR